MAGVLEMSDQLKSISIKGKARKIRSIPVGPKAAITVKGKFIKIGEVYDEYWLEPKDIPAPTEIMECLKNASGKPDIFTFAQKLPDVSPKYDYHMEWDNLAVANFESYAEWFDKQIDRNTKKNIRKFAKEGVRVEVEPFTDEFVNGICAIYNEIEVRQDRKFWHYGKDFETVKKENGTYLDRSIFIGAYFKDELIGFLKIVFDDEVGLLMQILSKSAYHEKRPTNALLSKAVEVCESRKVKYLTYGEYVYGKKDESSLIEFKKKNGFKKVDLPRYYIPLTLKGRLALRLGLHRDEDDWIPGSVRSALVSARTKWYRLTKESAK
jgi:hypothetical protein